MSFTALLYILLVYCFRKKMQINCLWHINGKAVRMDKAIWRQNALIRQTSNVPKDLSSRFCGCQQRAEADFSYE